MEPDYIWNLIAKKLTKEASPADLEELELALRINPDLHYSLQTITDFWESHPSIQKKFAERAYGNHLERMRALGVDFSETPPPAPAPSEPVYKPRRRKIAGMALLFVLLLGAAVYTFRAHPVPFDIGSEKRPSEVVTKYGSKTNLLLPDGSSVWLNAGSRLSYDSGAYGTSIREVTLSGEGFFDVVKNAEKPFIIHTGNIQIRVLGTAFNVKSYPDEKTIETSLIRGSIEVSFNDRSGRKVILKPNQKLVVDNDEHAAKIRAEHAPDTKSQPAPPAINPLTHFGPDSLITETAWVQNKLVFQDKSFTEVAEMMERWYAIRIRLDDASLDTLHLTGSFEKENISQALNALKLLSQFKYTLQNNEVHILNTNEK